MGRGNSGKHGGVASVVIDYGSGAGRAEYRKAPDGRLYNVTNQEYVESKASLKDVVQRARSAGYTVETYTAKQTEERDETRRKERENSPDYELGYGVPWGNQQYRRNARRNRINTRAQRRK